MTLELNQVSSQVKAMGRRLQAQRPEQVAALDQARALLRQFSTELDALHDRINRAETAQEGQRFGWVGAGPTTEALAEAYPRPTCPEPLTVIASDGSQILPDQHAIAPYFLINVGSITYRHGSNRKPDTYNPAPVLNYEPFDEQGRLYNPNFADYKLFSAFDMPTLETILVETHEATGPYGAKSVAEVPVNCPAPAIANAIFHAVGIRITELPITAEKVLKALQQRTAAS